MISDSCEMLSTTLLISASLSRARESSAPALCCCFWVKPEVVET